MPIEPTKAYLIRWSIANDMEAIVYAENADDALRRFDDGDIAALNNTGNDWRCRKPRARRWPEDDRNAE